ncbi:MAG TPA: septum formation initiator family protein [Gemmatimonadales bacterium]|nr:septum formation initiator family protein [Gemmatimonadales bacterium]
MTLRELVTPRRLIAAIVFLALLFGVEGGEYGTRDWLELKGQAREERDLVGALTGEVDSLATVLRRLEHDPATQEKVAREEFGMVREGEFLFRLIPGGDGEGER